MIKKLVCASVGMVAWAVIAAVGERPQNELIMSVEFAPFSDVKGKISEFGKTINNPVVSVMAVPALENVVTEMFGNFRPDAPMKFLCYADVATIRKALEAESYGGIGNALEPAFIYPCAEGAAKFLENHPEAQKKADGLVELEDGNVVLFAPDGGTCVFARKAAVAKHALKSALAKPKHAPKASAKPKKYPFVRMDVKKGGLDLLADLHKKLLDMQSKMAQGACAQEAQLAPLFEFQRAMGLRQNAALRDLAHATVVIDLDETGFVFRGSLKTKPGVSVSPAAGFTLPSGALADVPAGAPLFVAMNQLLSMDVRSEKEYRDAIGGVGQLCTVVASCVKKAAPEYAPVADGTAKAMNDMLAAIAYPAPTDWNMFALAFGPQQEPYMVGAGECAKMSETHAAGIRFYAALADVLGKKWPGIVSANGASLSVDWARLIDVVAAETGGSQASVDKAKKVVAKVLGGTASEITTVMPSQTSYRTFIGTKGFTPPAPASGEQRLAAALPEVASKRPAGVFYLSLYSFARDNLMPIVLKAVPEEEAKEIQPVVAMLPKASPNGAIAAAYWSEKNGSSRFLLRITKDEIRNIGMAVNAIIAAQSQPAQ